MDRAAYDRMAEIDGKHWWFTARRLILTDLIRHWVQPVAGAQILEIGCGTGSNIAMLQQFGTVDALEPDDEARAFAAERSGLQIKGGFLPQDAAVIPDGHYDMIAMLDVLEHIPQDGATLMALRDKLTAGGQMFVTVPATPWLWSAHDVAHHHQRRYTAAQLRTVFEQAGYRIRYMSHFNALLFPLVVAVRLLGKLTGRDSGDDAMPSKPVNAILHAIFAAERYLIKRASFSWGVSLVLIAEPIR